MSLLQAQVQFLFRELRSHKLHGAVKINGTWEVFNSKEEMNLGKLVCLYILNLRLVKLKFYDW